MTTVNIQLPAIPGASKLGKTLVEVDGQDITNGVRALTLHARAGDLTELHLDMAVHETTTVTGEAQVFMGDSARDALMRLGWTPPANLPVGSTDLAVRALCQAALNGGRLYLGDITVPGWIAEIVEQEIERAKRDTAEAPDRSPG